VNDEADIADVKGGKVSDMTSGYTEENSVHKRTAVSFVLESVNKK
jgi:hypothetical protein